LTQRAAIISLYVAKLVRSLRRPATFLRDT
jgi:hypothetical protein